MLAAASLFGTLGSLLVTRTVLRWGTFSSSRTRSRSRDV